MQQQPTLLLPEYFAVRITHGGRDGFALMRWTDGGLNVDNKAIHVFKSSNHNDGYYDNIVNNQTTHLRATKTNIIIKKGSGQLNHEAKWSHTGRFLRNNNSTFTIVHITPRTVLPVIKPNGFLPVRADPPVNANAPPLVPVPPGIPPAVPVQIQKRYGMNIIPQHAIKLIILGATIQDEECPITGSKIDIDNAAVTSCFHLFDKDALATWMALPTTRDKCPMCNQGCNAFSYIKNDVLPPLDM